jgi:hypothetical protein
VFQVFKCNKKVLLFVNIYNDCTYISHRQNLLTIACLIYLFIIFVLIIYILHCLVYVFFFLLFYIQWLYQYGSTEINNNLNLNLNLNHHKCNVIFCLIYCTSYLTIYRPYRAIIRYVWILPKLFHYVLHSVACLSFMLSFM